MDEMDTQDIIETLQDVSNYVDNIPIKVITRKAAKRLEELDTANKSLESVNTKLLEEIKRLNIQNDSLSDHIQSLDTELNDAANELLELQDSFDCYITEHGRGES